MLQQSQTSKFARNLFLAHMHHILHSHVLIHKLQFVMALSDMCDLTIGPLITAYIVQRPSRMEHCVPCLGPRSTRWQTKSTVLSRKRPCFCICNGAGFCDHTLDVGPKLTLRCTCTKVCLDEPMTMWKHQAWKVLQVLKLRGRLQAPAEVCTATSSDARGLAKAAAITTCSTVAMRDWPSERAACIMTHVTV